MAATSASVGAGSQGELVFVNEDGTHLRPGQFRELLWGAQRRAGLRRIPWHGLRHSFASILVSGGTPLSVVQRWLGALLDHDQRAVRSPRARGG